MEDKKMSTKTGNYTERSKPIITSKYKPGQNTVLAIGYMNDRDGIFLEWVGEAKIVVRKDGIDYKQTFAEFINNCV